MADASDPPAQCDIESYILESSRRRARKHLEDEDYRDQNLALRRTTEHVAREYHGRVVLELVQNAHDALPKDRRDGRVLVE